MSDHGLNNLNVEASWKFLYVYVYTLSFTVSHLLLLDMVQGDSASQCDVGFALCSNVHHELPHVGDAAGHAGDGH